MTWTHRLGMPVEHVQFNSGLGKYQYQRMRNYHIETYKIRKGLDRIWAELIFPLACCPGARDKLNGNSFKNEIRILFIHRKGSGSLEFSTQRLKAEIVDF